MTVLRKGALQRLLGNAFHPPRCLAFRELRRRLHTHRDHQDENRLAAPEHRHFPPTLCGGLLPGVTVSKRPRHNHLHRVTDVALSPLDVRPARASHLGSERLKAALSKLRCRSLLRCVPLLRVLLGCVSGLLRGVPLWGLLELRLRCRLLRVLLGRCLLRCAELERLLRHVDFSCVL